MLDRLDWQLADLRAAIDRAAAAQAIAAGIIGEMGTAGRATLSGNGKHEGARPSDGGNAAMRTALDEDAGRVSV